MAQLINRVDHVAYMCRPENHDAYVDKLQALFEFEFEAAFRRQEDGLRLTWSWSTGLEILSPIGTTGPLAQRGWDFLNERGEGVYSIIMGVADIEKTRERARELGYSPSEWFDLGCDEPWTKDVEVKECVVEKFMGANLALGQIVFPD